MKILDLLHDLAAEDVVQIKNDWEFIAAKIKKGQAHLLSEADTYYLGACTKAKNSFIFRQQPNNQIPAQPRAFSFKQTYLNYLIRKNFLGEEIEGDTLFEGRKKTMTIDEVVREKFAPFIGKTDKEIMESFGITSVTKRKDYKRYLANMIMVGKNTRRIEEFKKADVILRVVTLEPSGSLTESLSFPVFDYKEIVKRKWDDVETDEIAEFHELLETKRFLFVVFQKIRGTKDIVLKRFIFWNFPMADMAEAKQVYDKTVECIQKGRYGDLPKMSENRVAHVRPHASNCRDTKETPQHTREVKRCFWLNAKYIQSFLSN